MALSNVAQSVRRAIDFRRRRRVPGLDQLQHVPPNLRATDPSLAIEMANGTIGLPSGLLKFGAASPFTTALREPASARDLFAFAWFAHLDAARTEQSEHLMRALLLDWSRNAARRSALAAEPAVMARRALSLLAHADGSLATAAASDFDAIMDLLAEEFADLAREVKRMPLTLARLTARIALVAFDLAAGADVGACVANERVLAVELKRQILPDGGHMSRNPQAVLETALDLVALRRLYTARQRPVPAPVTDALGRTTKMLLALQMPDQSLGRFNGMGATPIGDLLSVMRQLAPGADKPGPLHAPETGYARLAAAGTVVLFDAGPGAETLAGEAPFAGALSFELGAGTVSIVVNCGAGFEQPPKPSARATTAHSALGLAGTSSAPPTGARSGQVRCTLDVSSASGQTLTAASDGYKVRNGEVHHRSLTLSADGRRLDGIDRLEAHGQAPATAPFEIHFHLHPSVFVEPAADRRTITLKAGDGSVWSFDSGEIIPSIESSIYHAAASGPKPSVQLVVRGLTSDTREVRWHFARIHDAIAG